MPPILNQGAPSGAGSNVDSRSQCCSVKRRRQRTYFFRDVIDLGKNADFCKLIAQPALFIDVLYHYREQRKYFLHEFVVMPEHFHALITVGADMTVEKATQLIKGGFAFRAGREFGFQAPFWQKGFSEIRVSEAEAFMGIREYIRGNPLKRSLGANYPYSSANSEFELDPPPQRLKALLERPTFGIAKATP